jgi:hypothetical protein
MRVSRGVAVALSTSALVTSWVQRAEAQSSAQSLAPTSYSLSWARGDGAEGCPSARALAADVEQRLGRKVFDSSAEQAFEVQVTKSSGRYHSDVFVRDADGRPLGQRALESDEPDCSAVFNATALAIALVIDPEAASREPKTSPAMAAFEALPPAPPAPVPPPPPPPAPEPKHASPVPARAHTPTSIAARAELSGALVPDISTGLALVFMARPDERFGFSVTAGYTAPRPARGGGGVYDIGLTRAGLALTYDAARSSKLRLALSAGLNVGAFHVGVREPAPVIDSGDFLYFSGELGAAVQVSVSTGVFLEIGGAGLLNPLRQEFLVADSSEPVWHQSLVSGIGFMGLGVAFP